MTYFTYVMCQYVHDTFSGFLLCLSSEVRSSTSFLRKFALEVRSSSSFLRKLVLPRLRVFFFVVSSSSHNLFNRPFDPSLHENSLRALSSFTIVILHLPFHQSHLRCYEPKLFRALTKDPFSFEIA